MQRRKLLSGCGIVLAGVLAGCGGGSDGDGGDSTPTSTPESETPTETPMQEATETEAPTDTPAETATPTAEPTDEFTHEMGEEFTVGEGDNAVTYRIVDLFRTDKIGSGASNTEANRTFLIVVLDLTNPRNSELPFPRGNFRVQTEGSWRRFDREGTEKINADERLNVDQIGDSTLPSGETATGAVAFDVDPDSSYRIWITPTGDAETPEHFVSVGEISSVEELQGSLTG